MTGKWKDPMTGKSLEELEMSITRRGLIAAIQENEQDKAQGIIYLALASFKECGMTEKDANHEIFKMLRKVEMDTGRNSNIIALAEATHGQTSAFAKMLREAGTDPVPAVQKDKTTKRQPAGPGKK